MTGAVKDVSQIAAQNNCSIRHVNITISMAFIAPDLVKAAIEGPPSPWHRHRQSTGRSTRMVTPVRATRTNPAGLIHMTRSFAKRILPFKDHHHRAKVEWSLLPGTGIPGLETGL